MFIKNRWWVVILVSAILVSGNERAFAAQSVSHISLQDKQNILDQCLAENSNVAFHEQTGYLSFVGTNADASIKKLAVMDSAESPEQAGRGYLSVCGSLFGLTDQSTELQTKRQSQTQDGRHVLHFQQTHQGIPVFAGELNMQLTANNDVIMVNGEILPDINVDTSPDVATNAAQQAALEAIVQEYQLYYAGNLAISEPELWIYNPGLIGDPEGLSVLAWRMEVVQDGPPLIRHLVFVDARNGSIALNLNQLYTAKNIETYDTNNGTDYSAATLVCDSSDPNCTAGGEDTDAVNAHIYAGDAYDFYMSHHGRDSIDNAGMTIKSYVHYDSGWCNARWIDSVMRYGDGCSSSIVADDVVGHELTHGVTNYESSLVYANQSGAINESFSDIWGEFIDLSNGKGTDTVEVRWQIGEDAYEVIRDMENPPSYIDPDKMTSFYYYTGSDDDIYVHTNSGVGNKAAYLITDGAAFNRYTNTGIGIDKTAKIYYEVQTNILTSGANYADLGNALIQACNTLVGTSGITTEDCNQVRIATYATEMLTPPIPTPGIPNGNFRDRTPEYTWTRENGATDYKIQLKQGQLTVYTKTVDSSACGGSICSNTPSGLLGYNTYQWRVRAKVGGAWGPWSSYITFKVLKPAPQTPSSNITDRTPEYAWTEEVGATSYQINLKNGLITVYTKTVDSNTCANSICSTTPSDLLGYKTYKWRVRAKAGDVWGAWSLYKTFTVVNDGFNSTFNSNKNGWETVNGSWSIYNFSYLKTNGLQDSFVSTYYNQDFSILNYQVKMKRFGCTYCANALYVRGTPYPTWNGGLGCVVCWQAGYYFAYSNSGVFSIWIINNTQTIPLQNWTESAAINKGSWNTLKVIADGSTLKFYINNTLVWSGSDSTLTDGKVGITMYRDAVSTGNKLYVDWANLSPTDLGNSLIYEQVETGQVELEGSEEMGPAFVVPNTP